MRFGGACTRIRTQHMLYKIYVLFQSCRCPNLEQSVEDSVSYKSFLSEDSERSFSGMRKIPVEADFLFFYSTVPGEAMEFSVENMHAFVIIENYCSIRITVLSIRLTYCVLQYEPDLFYIADFICI